MFRVCKRVCRIKVKSVYPHNRSQSLIQKGKGVNKKTVDDKLKYEDYKNILFSRPYMRHEMNKIQNKYRNIGLHRINKHFFGCLQ